MFRRVVSLSLLCAATAALVHVPAARSAGAGAPQRLTLAGGPATMFTVEGIYPHKPGACEAKRTPPLRAKYRGRVDVVLGTNGRLRIIDTLSFGQYLHGIAEVPPSWPPAALRAQAIAARSYVLDAYRRGGAKASSRGYDICATDQCQVYRGATVELGAFGERWVAAVDATRGRVLTYGGHLVQAFYFSTSDGKTRASFPGGSSRPYYPVVSGEDADAPLASWTARIALADLTKVLRSRGWWTGGAISGASRTGNNVSLTDGSMHASLAASDIRRALNNDAPCLSKDRYPPEDAGARLPQTVPSSTYTLRAVKGVAIFIGRGWGHGVGMSQWGARSLAARGRSTEQILHHYYGPATVGTVSEPNSVRVLAAEQLGIIRISADGPFSARTETGGSLGSAGRFEVRGGKTLQIFRGKGPSLAPILTVGASAPITSTTVGGTLTIAFVLSRAARVAIRLTQGGTLSIRTPETSFEHGEGSTAVAMRDARGSPLSPGTYQATVEAYDGIDRVRSSPVALTILAPPRTARGTPWALPAGIAAAIVLVLALFVGHRRRARAKHRTHPNVNV